MEEVIPTIKERLIAWCKGRARNTDDLQKAIELIETRDEQTAEGRSKNGGQRVTTKTKI